MAACFKAPQRLAHRKGRKQGKAKKPSIQAEKDESEKQGKPRKTKKTLSESMEAKNEEAKRQRKKKEERKKERKREREKEAREYAPSVLPLFPFTSLEIHALSCYVLLCRPLLRG